MTAAAIGIYREHELLFRFIYLQMLDLLTTLAFLPHGVEEANPLVRLFLSAGPTPLLGLLIAKTLAISLGMICYGSGRTGLLHRANIIFACIAVWNLLMVIVSNGIPAR